MLKKLVLFNCFAFLFWCIIPASVSQAQKVSGDQKWSTNVAPSPDELNFTITGGKRVESNLFHSFSEFSIPTGGLAFFADTTNVQNIIARVTSDSVSKIDGLIKTDPGSSANIFLINPNGIVFGPQSQLDIGGSFIASTASQIDFSDSKSFSVKDNSPAPLLSVGIPIGLRFGDQSGSVRNQSQAVVSLFDGSITTSGLLVEPGRTLALLGTGVFLESGGLVAPGGNVEIGSVAGGSFVSLQLQPNSDKWVVGYNNENDFQDILAQDSKIFVSSDGGGSVNIKGEKIIIDNSRILSESYGDRKGENIDFSASDLVVVKNKSTISTQAVGDNVGGNITINAKQFRLNENSKINTGGASEEGAGAGGNIDINAPELVEIKGGSKQSVITTLTDGSGNAGKLTIQKTNKLILEQGGVVSTSTVGTGNAGELNIVNALELEVRGLSADGFASGILSQSKPDEDNVENAGAAGNLTIKSGKLSISDGGIISVKSDGSASAGNLKVNATEIFLNNGFINADTNGGEGNIQIINSERLLLTNNSLISTNATGSANGGNITINTAIVIALSPTGSNGSDIVAKALGGNGGDITINSQGIFGIENREAILGNQSNDIDTRSQFGLSGQVQINTSTNVNQGLVELPATVLDPNTIVSQHPCDRGWNSSFTLKGRGGNPQTPRQDLSPAAIQVGLVDPAPMTKTSATANHNPTASIQGATKLQSPTDKQISPAQGWVYNSKGEVVLVAYNPTLTAEQRLQQHPVCTAKE